MMISRRPRIMRRIITRANDVGRLGTRTHVPAYALVACVIASTIGMPMAEAKPSICDQLSRASSVQDVWAIFDEFGAQKVADTSYVECPQHGLLIVAALTAKK